MYVTDARAIYNNERPQKNGPSRKKKKKKEEDEEEGDIYILRTLVVFLRHKEEFFVSVFFVALERRGIVSKAGKKNTDAFVRVCSAVRRRHLCLPGRETTTTTKKQPGRF